MTPDFHLSDTFPRHRPAQLAIADRVLNLDHYDGSRGWDHLIANATPVRDGAHAAGEDQDPERWDGMG